MRLPSVRRGACQLLLSRLSSRAWAAAGSLKRRFAADPISPITHFRPNYPCVTINPRLIAMAIASVRPMASNFAKIDFTWALTVFSLM